MFVSRFVVRIRIIKGEEGKKLSRNTCAVISALPLSESSSQPESANMCFHGPFSVRPSVVPSSSDNLVGKCASRARRRSGPRCSIHQFYSAQKHLSGVTLFRPLWRRQESEGLTSNEISTFSLSQISILKGLLHLFFEKGAVEAEVSGARSGGRGAISIER